MSYFSEQHLEAAVERLIEQAHPRLISLLAMLKHELVQSTSDADAKSFGSPQERDLLDSYFSPAGAPNGRPFYIPFGSDIGVSRWRETTYPAKSLQRLRSDRKAAFLQASDKKRWNIAPSFSQLAAADNKLVGEVPIELWALAVWCYRLRDWTSVSDAIAEFDREFRLSANGLVPNTFTTTIPAEIAALSLISQPVESDALLAILAKHSSTPKTAALAVGIRSDSSGLGWAGLDADDSSGELRGVDEAVTRARAALAAGMHVIFTGPPGTGKTTLAKSICDAAGYPSWVVPATDQWSTFETIGGYFPDPEAAGQTLNFLPGAIVDAIESGACLIIDEINRADIDKAFGELLTLLSGTSVTLPFKRRVATGAYKRVALVVNDSDVGEDFDVIAVPPWWRLIGSMNDVDKASLKRLSMAFVRRFAFVPVGIPKADDYKAIIEESLEKLTWPEGVDQTVSQLKVTLLSMFASPNQGFPAIGFQLGPAIPIAMLNHACSELTIDAGRSLDQLVASCLELYVFPQLQGRPDLHEDVLATIGPHVGASVDESGQQLAVWTGYFAS